MLVWQMYKDSTVFRTALFGLRDLELEKSVLIVVTVQVVQF